MSTRKMRGPFGRRSIIFVVLAVVLAMAGLVWAHWWTSLHVDATINTGNVGIQWGDIWTNDDGWVNDWDGGDDHSPTAFEWFGDESSADPADYGDARYDKDVGGCWAGGGGGDYIWIDIGNAYPSYHCTAQTSIRNVGSVPVKALPSNFEVMKGEQDCDWWFSYDEGSNWFYDRTGYHVRDAEYMPGEWRPYVENGGNETFDAGDWWILWDETGGFDYVDKSGDMGVFDADDEIVFGGCNFYGEPLAVEHYGGGDFAWGFYDEFDNFHPEITGHVPSLFECGTQIDPGFDEGVQFNFHVEQEAQQNATYRFSAHQDFVNWNEFADFSCGLGEGQLGEFVKGMGARWKSFGNTGSNELYVGVGDLGVGANRAEAGYTWGDGWYHLQMWFDPGADTLYAAINDEVELSWGNVSATAGCPVSEMDLFQLHVFDRDDGMVEFHDFQINGNPAGGPYIGGDSWPTATWNLAGYNFGDGFHVSGNLYIEGPFGGDENSKVEFAIGCD